MPYDNLIKRLWECASGECFNCSQYTETTNASVCSKELMKQVADAIEELVGFVQEAERDRDEYRERLDKANDAVEELERKEKFHAFLWNTIQPNEMEQYLSMYRAQAVPSEPPKEE